MKVAYIGPKGIKVDKVSGSRQNFPRFEPMEVEKEHAVILLRFPDVYVEEKDLEAAMARIEVAAQKKIDQQEKLVADKKKELTDASRVIELDGKEVDLGKFTSIKLDTLVESNDLDVEKIAGESKAVYCDRVFAAFIAKNSASDQGE